MSRILLRAIAVTVVAVGLLSGCSEGPSPVGPGASIPLSDRVTDVAAIALTEEEAERILDACGDATDLPEPGSPCWDAIEDVPPPAGDVPPNCSEVICLNFDSPVDGAVPIHIQDPRPGSPLCDGRAVCESFSVPSELVDDVMVEVPPEPTETTETGTETTSEVEPTEEPTDEPTDVPPST